MPNQSINTTVNNCDDDLSADISPVDGCALQSQDITVISEQTTYAQVVASQPSHVTASETINHTVSNITGGSTKKSNQT